MCEGMVTVGQAARRCPVSRGIFFRRVKSGEIRASRKPGGHCRILKKDPESFVLEKGIYPLAYNHSSRKTSSSLIMNPVLGNCSRGASNPASMKRKQRQTASRGRCFQLIPRYRPSQDAMWRRAKSGFCLPGQTAVWQSLSIWTL